MSTDAALDDFAFAVSLRLIGPDARRRLRIELARNPDCTNALGFNVEAAEHLDALLDGRRPPEGTQDHWDLARAARDRNAPPFDPGFWARHTADLIRAGFEPEAARRLVDTVRADVEPSREHPSEEPAHVE